MTNEQGSSVTSAVVRVHHSVDVIDGCSTTKNVEIIDITMFKTLKITNTTSAEEIIRILSQKLTLKDRDKFNIYTLDSQYNNIKRKLDANEIPLLLVENDISKKLKFAILHDEEASKFQSTTNQTEFYNLSGNSVTGPFPKTKENILPYAGELLRHRKLLNPELAPFMNLTMIVEGEKGKERICSLRSIVEQRCPSLLLAVNFIKKKKEKKGSLLGPMTIEYKDGTIMNSFVLTQFLEWCYTSTLDFKSLTIPDVMVVLKASQQFGIPHLEFICEQYIRSELTVDTSFVILKQASLLQMDDIKALATNFAHEKWGQFAVHKGGMDIIGIEIFQELTIAMNQRQDGNPVNVKKLAHVKDSLVEDFKVIYNESRFSDAEMVVDDKRYNFHKAILAAYSKQFFGLITQTKGKEFTLEGLHSDAVNDLLEFIYFKKKKLDPVGAVEIIEHAMNQFALHDIREIASDSISEGINCNNAVPILRLTYLPQCKHRSMVKLRENVLEFMCENFKSVPIPSLRDLEHSNFGHHLMADVLDAFFYRENPNAKAKFERKKLEDEALRRRTLVHKTPKESNNEKRSRQNSL